MTTTSAHELPRSRASPPAARCASRSRIAAKRFRSFGRVMVRTYGPRCSPAWGRRWSGLVLRSAPAQGLRHPRPAPRALSLSRPDSRAGVAAAQTALGLSRGRTDPERRVAWLPCWSARWRYPWPNGPRLPNCCPNSRPARLASDRPPCCLSRRAHLLPSPPAAVARQPNPFCLEVHVPPNAAITACY